MTERVDLQTYDMLAIPETCRGCLSLSLHLETWQKMQFLTDMAIQISTDETPTELLELMPDELVITIGLTHGEELDPAESNDRKRALDFVNSDHYDYFKEHIEEEESSIRTLLGFCEGKGPVKARIPAKDGAKVILRLCRGEVEGACADHEHIIPSSIKKEF
jgi:hypothetical protein